MRRVRTHTREEEEKDPVQPILPTRRTGERERERKKERGKTEEYTKADSNPNTQTAAVSHHKKFFGGEDDGAEADAPSMGNAAAMQALKMFSGGGGSSSGGGQSEFIGLAMSEASKLFEQQSSAGRVSSGASKESAVQQAGEMALKMYMKSQAQSSGGLMSLASKFM